MGQANPCVIRRGSRLHFRRTVPTDLRRRIGRRELTLGLGTAEARPAKLAALRHCVASEQLFTALRASPMLTETELARLVQDFYDTVLMRENALRLRGRLIDDDEVKARGAHDADLATETRKALATNRLHDAQIVTEGVLRKNHVPLDQLTPEDWNLARQVMLRAGGDLAEVLQARYAGDFNHEPKDKLLKLKLDAEAVLGSQPAGVVEPPTAGAGATIPADIEPTAPAAPPEPCLVPAFAGSG